MLKVISFKICPFVQRVTALLEAKQIPYDIEFINLSDKPQWFIELSPNDQVPILISPSGIALFESDAIIEYLYEVYGPLESTITPEQRAIDRAWSYQASKHYLKQCSAMRSPNREAFEERVRSLDNAFAKAEKAINHGPYFKGNTLSHVDIAWLPILHRAAIIKKHTCYDFLEKYPKVSAWQSTLLDTDLATRSVPEDFEAAFTRFYLSDETFLGAGTNCDSRIDCKCESMECC